MTAPITEIVDDELVDLNLMVLAGRLTAKPEIRDNYVRLLVTVRSYSPTATTTTTRQRVDVLPVIVWEPDPDTLADLESADRGTRVWISGSIQRRFWDKPDGRRSRVELVAEQVTL